MSVREAVYIVTVSGQNITAKLRGIVTEITVHDAAGQTSDTASVTLDDHGGRIRMPQKDDPISIALGWSDTGARLVFEGMIDGVTSTGGRGQGRLIAITAKSANMRSKIKEHREKHWDKKKLGEVVQDAGSYAGLSVTVHPSLASIERDYWSMANQSFVAFGDKIAREVGATFKIKGNRAVMVPRNEGIGAAGSALSPIRAIVGDNLIQWSITPATSRPQFKKFVTRWFDYKTGKWKQETVEAGAQVEPQSTDRYSEADSETSEKRAGSSKKGGDREKGSGSVTIDGDPDAQAEAPVIIIGTRPGIDGTYRADSVEHNYTRGGGYICTIEVKQPDGEAGSDNRSSGSSGSYGEAGAPAGGNVA